MIVFFLSLRVIDTFCPAGSLAPQVTFCDLVSPGSRLKATSPDHRMRGRGVMRNMGAMGDVADTLIQTLAFTSAFVVLVAVTSNTGDSSAS